MCKMKIKRNDVADLSFGICARFYKTAEQQRHRNKPN